ncbi:MAG: PorT family protein [Bacteroidetes bacterium]|nr:PorT family protein [Bacteroidota bacterium]
MRFNVRCSLLLALVMLCLSAESQVNVGIRAGVNMSTITNGLQSGFEKRVAFGPGGGMIVNVPVRSNIHVQPEVLINARGPAYKIWTVGVAEKGIIRLYYIDIPLTVKGYLGSGMLRGFLGTGPQFSVGLFLQSIYRQSAVGISEKRSNVEAFPDLYNRFEMSWNVDAGLRLDLDNSSAIELGVRPMIGVTQLVKSEFSGEHPRNIMINLSAAYLFGK